MSKTPLTASFLQEALNLHGAWMKGNRGPEMLEIVLEDYEELPLYIAEIRRLRRARTATPEAPAPVEAEKIVQQVLADYKQQNMQEYLSYMERDEEPDEEIVSMLAAHNMAAGLLEEKLLTALRTTSPCAR